MNNLYYRLTLTLTKTQSSWKEPFKSSEIPKFGRDTENIALQSSQICMVLFLCHVWKLLPF